MIIDKLEVKGKDKKPAVVKFYHGLNVIAGPSDTGKSYISQCFKFIFGSSKVPKSISQSEGYTSLEVTFIDGEDKFLLKRELKEKSDLVLVELSNDGLTTTLKPDHKGKKNLSSFFLNRVNLSGKIMAKGLENLTHASLTLRILEQIFVIDESRIISENSPLGTGQHIEKTQEYALLRTLLTGDDDSSIKEMKGDRESKSSIKNKLDNLKQFLERYFSSEEVSKSSIEELDKALVLIEESIEFTESDLEEVIGSNCELLEERKSLASKMEALDSRLDSDCVLLDRFKLLLDKYASDSERLSANSEAASYLEKQEMANCPTCGGVIDSSESSDVDVELILQSNNAEISKISEKVIGLRSTINDISKNRDSILMQRESLKGKLSGIDSKLQTELSSKIKEYNSTIKQLNKEKSKLKYLTSEEKKRQGIVRELGELQLEYDKITDTYEFPSFSSELSEFTNEISTILGRWGFPNSKTVNFDKSTRDIVVGGKPRSHFGKGYRAICFSAFAVALMAYLKEKGRHPGFLILDSPLTTYKERDEVAPIEEEDEQTHIANNLIYGFYRDLCDFYSDSQIIVLDNQEPDRDLIQYMNYTHFSQNEHIGRYGFFPLQG